MQTLTNKTILNNVKMKSYYFKPNCVYHVFGASPSPENSLPLLS